MTKNKVLVIFFFFFLLLAGFGALADGPDRGDECLPTSCSDEGPEIRFPFWLKNHQPDSCGYGSGFALTCSPTNNETLLDNPFSVKVVVESINYSRQSLIYELSGDYAPHQKNLSLLFNTSSFSLFHLLAASTYIPSYHSVYFNDASCEYSIFSCLSSVCGPYSIGGDYGPNGIDGDYGPDLDSIVGDYGPHSIGGDCIPLRCLSRPGQYFCLVNSRNLFRPNLLKNCKKMDTIPSIPCPYERPYVWSSYTCSRGGSSWYEPSCLKCEEEGKYCRLSSSNNGKKHETECFGINPRSCSKCNRIGMSCSFRRSNNSNEEEAECVEFDHRAYIYTSEKKSPLVKGLTPPGIFLLVAFVLATYFAHRSNILKKEDQLKIERFLENYRALKPTRYTYADIKKITHDLKDKLGQGGYGTVFKGELSNDVPIAAKILNNFTGNGDDFINEVGTIGTIHHVNVVRLVGYCADGYKRALVYEYLSNGSLEKFISSDHKKASLGWEKLQDIALGIAKGIEYLHQGCDQRILHFDIKPHNILLDKNFIPKISDFGLAKLCSKEQSAVSMTAARGTVGYIAPEVFSRNFGNVSHKSDVYSFGMLLLEMVGGRKKNFDVRTEENSDEVYFPEWIYNRLNREELNNSEVERGGDAKIVKKLTIVGLWCIQWYPGDRPSMKAVVQMLEGDGDTLAMPPNPFSTTSHSTTKGNMGERPFSSILEIISESD